MNELQIFNNEKYGEIRTSIINDEPYFMLADVCRVLEIVSPTRTKERLNKNGVHTMKVIDNLNRPQQATFINESNLYKLAFTSRKKEAEEFTEWVTSEVLPSIRKHGAYLTPDKIEEVLTNPDTIIRLATELKQEREAKQKALVALEQVNKELEEAQPKLTYYDTILNSVGTMTSSQIGADYGMSAIKLNKILNEQKLIKKVNNQWILYAKYQNQGLTESKTFDVEHGSIVGSYVSTRWTQKGRLKIHEILTKLGYVANVDKSINRMSKRDKFVAQEKARQLSHIA